VGLYTRKEYEGDCKQIDAQIARSASLLGQQLIGPMQHWQRAEQLERLKKKLGQKLAMTALALADKSKMERSKQYAWVIGAKKEHEASCSTRRNAGEKQHYCNCNGQWFISRKTDPLIKWNSPHYRNTSIMEIHALQNEGVTVMESGFMKRTKDKNAVVEDVFEFQPFQWTETTETDAQIKQDEGDVVEIEGKLEFHAHYMIRSEGEGDNRKFYYTDVR